MNELTLWAAFLAAAAALVLQLARARQSRSRRWFHLVVALVPLYFCLFYGLIITDVIPTPSLQAAGWSRTGIMLMMLILAAYALAYWKDDNCT